MTSFYTQILGDKVKKDKNYKEYESLYQKRSVKRKKRPGSHQKII